MPVPHEFEIRPVGMPASRAARTAPIIASSGPSPAKRRSIRPPGSTASIAPKSRSKSASETSPRSSLRSSASPSPPLAEELPHGVAARGPPNRRRRRSSPRCWSSGRRRNRRAAHRARARPRGTPISPGTHRLPRMEEEYAPEGIDAARVDTWITANVEGAKGPFTYVRIAGGRSNLTYRVTDAGGRRWALRRPPLGKALGSAHDMGREHTRGLRPGADARARRPDRRLLHRRGRKRRALLPDGLRRGADPAPASRRRRLPGSRRPPRDRRAGRRHAGRDPPAGPRRGRARRARQEGGLRQRGSSSAGRGSGRDRRRARSPSSRTSPASSATASPSRDRRRSSTATTAWTT